VVLNKNEDNQKWVGGELYELPTRERRTARAWGRVAGKFHVATEALTAMAFGTTLKLCRVVRTNG
jgi:Ser/Thr protein kinase RdoA (MazF antagonist)